MARYQLITYDVWGNAKDGYEVNQAFTTNEFYELDGDADNATIIKALRKQGGLKKGVKSNLIDIDGDADLLAFYYNGRPEFELRKMEV